MKRTGMGALLLILLLGAGILSARAVNCRNGELADRLEAAAEQAVAGNLQEAIPLAEQARESWEAGWGFCAAVTDHEPMEQIDTGFARLRLYGRVGDEMAFAAVCVELAEQVRSVGDAHGAQWWNIL